MTGSEHEKDAGQRGYGNIYTPHAGAMIIHVQRESGLANRTIILTSRQVRFLRIGAIVAAVLIVVGATSWFYLAAQASRVPLLSRRVAALQRDVQQLDTLKHALSELDARFQQVQRMMGASAAPMPAGTGPANAADSAGLPTAWPLPVAGALVEAPSGSPKPNGVEIAVARGTAVRAAGAGLVVEVRNDSLHGQMVRLRHRLGYESLYGNLLAVRVARGDKIVAGAIIALTGDSTAAYPAHLHFEIVHDGVQVNPTSFVTKGPLHGDLQ
jgi:murein DD-endopeptidase MepM/ murein hydrolase activator NlpD